MSCTYHSTPSSKPPTFPVLDHTSKCSRIVPLYLYRAAQPEREEHNKHNLVYMFWRLSNSFKAVSKSLLNTRNPFIATIAMHTKDATEHPFSSSVSVDA